MKKLFKLPALSFKSNTLYHIVKSNFKINCSEQENTRKLVQSYNNASTVDFKIIYILSGIISFL